MVAHSPSRSASLPIDARLPDLLKGLETHRNFVIQAEPGAGKTTRVPLALLEHGLADTGEIWIAQPRRIAARMAARRVADELGTPLGDRCGYQVRFEAKVSPATQLRFVTEGILARRLRDDPDLSGVAMVILDEFHERHIDTDVCLALLRHRQLKGHPIRIGVMSATLAADPIAAYLDCSPLTCEGRTFPVHIEHQPRATDKPLQHQVAAALRTLGPLEGHVLVFLPGAREIRQSLTACRPIASQLGLDVVSLHGDLPAHEQDQAVNANRPRVILSTNIAETSVTIAGVVAVIDSGLARRASHNPWSGMPTLTLGKISQASAIQRAGRAGRTQAGRCIRLYTQHDFDRRPAFDTPELARLDLSAAMLDLRAAGVFASDDLPWFEGPPPAARDAAESLLQRLEALSLDGQLTPTGRAMLRHPVHPRLAKLIVEGERLGIASSARGVAAILSERPIGRSSTDSAESADSVGYADPWWWLEKLNDRSRASKLDPTACAQVRRVRAQLGGPRRDDAPDPELALCRALMRAFPDRIGQRRSSTSPHVTFADGHQGVLAPASVVSQSPLLVAVDVQTRGTGTSTETIIRQAAHLEADWLLEDLLDDVSEQIVTRFDTSRERVETTEQLRLGTVVIEERALDQPVAETFQALRDAALTRGPAYFVDNPDDLHHLLYRTHFAHRFDPQIPILDDAAARDQLSELCEGRRSFAELRQADLVASLRSRLDPTAFTRLDRLAPSHIHLASGRRLKVHYEPDRDPWVASRLQDFFGLKHGPTLAGGQRPLVLHLLAPNQRPVQVTTDLDGFWERHYPELRRTLMRRYPKHAWPEDPRTATPPQPRRQSRR